MLALTTGDEVYEYCMNRKMVYRKIMMPVTFKID